MNLATLESQKNMKTLTKFSLLEKFGENAIMLLIMAFYGLFAYFAIHIFSAYQAELTGLNQFLSPVSELPLPTITVCPKELFKNITSETTPEMVLQNIDEHVFSWEDLFDETFASPYLTKLFDSWHPHREIFSKSLGLCYSLRAKKDINPQNYYNFFIYLPIGKKYQVINQNWHSRNCYWNLVESFFM